MDEVSVKGVVSLNSSYEGVSQLANGNINSYVVKNAVTVVLIEVSASTTADVQNINEIVSVIKTVLLSYVDYGLVDDVPFDPIVEVSEIEELTLFSLKLILFLLLVVEVLRGSLVVLD